MLYETNLDKKLGKEEYKEKIEPLKQKLERLALRIKEEKLPVIILFEGFGAAGKGSMISKLIDNIDPRGFSVHTIAKPTETELRMPPMWRYWNTIPQYGQISVMDRSWYRDVSVDSVDDYERSDVIEQNLEDIRCFERQLVDGGYLIIKFFLQISKSEQKKRFEKLEESSFTKWRVTKEDWRHNREYEKHLKAFDEMIESTSVSYAPWTVVEATDKRYAFYKVLSQVVERIEQALDDKQHGEVKKQTVVPKDFEIVKTPLLSEIDLNRSAEENQYRKELKRYQKRLGELHSELYLRKIPMIIAYEGWDAAGKGGNIKRVTKALDPRGYEVVPIAAPTKIELEHHYLWRFWSTLPKSGHITIFDRSWYGRVMVERIEGFCTKEDWQHAYREINEFEQYLYEHGMLVMKFWLHIDKDEQLKRFQKRQNTPEKRWKITEEDFRNREKWDQYEIAVNEMLQKTNTENCPWFIIESNDKRYARLKAMKKIVEYVEHQLEIL